MGAGRGDPPQDPGRQSGTTLRFPAAIEAGGGHWPPLLHRGWGTILADSTVFPNWADACPLSLDCRLRGAPPAGGGASATERRQRHAHPTLRAGSLSVLRARGGDTDSTPGMARLWLAGGGSQHRIAVQQRARRRTVAAGRRILVARLVDGLFRAGLHRQA